MQVLICGSWIWLSGNTKENKEKIQSINIGTSYKRGFSGPKKMWYFAPSGYKRFKFNAKSTPIERIRNIYGSEVIERDSQRRIAA